MASPDSGNGALTGTCPSLKLKPVPRMPEMGNLVETARLGAEDESMARLPCYIAESEYRIATKLQ
jgi:hypothetical protein